MKEGEGGKGRGKRGREGVYTQSQIGVIVIGLYTTISQVTTFQPDYAGLPQVSIVA